MCCIADFRALPSCSDLFTACVGMYRCTAPDNAQASMSVHHFKLCHILEKSGLVPSLLQIAGHLSQELVIIPL